MYLKLLFKHKYIYTVLFFLLSLNKFFFEVLYNIQTYICCFLKACAVCILPHILAFFELYIIILTYDTLRISQVKLVYCLISLFCSKPLANAVRSLILYLTVYSLLLPLVAVVRHTSRRVSDHPETVIFLFYYYSAIIGQNAPRQRLYRVFVFYLMYVFSFAYIKTIQLRRLYKQNIFFLQ